MPFLRELVAKVLPGSSLEDVSLLAPDEGGGDTRKIEGYGRPLRVVVRGPRGDLRVLVFHTAATNAFGHDRRSDRAQQMLLSFDTFAAIPNHVRPVDVGALLPAGRLVSLREAGELYLVTEFAEGTVYANHLRRIAAEGVATPGDVERCEDLSRWLLRLHAERFVEPESYVRAVRDLLGHGEGIFGMVDGYPREVPAAPWPRLRAIEEKCLWYRWRLRGEERRLRRTHGDFHPFNVVCDGERFTLLDASRGCKGDPADDVTAMAINFVFFAIDHPQAWNAGLGVLWRRFWEAYLSESGDKGLLEVCPPWLAWRCLVVCSPRFYPDLSLTARDKILGLAERALDARRFDPAWAEELFR